MKKVFNKRNNICKNINPSVCIISRCLCKVASRSTFGLACYDFTQATRSNKNRRINILTLYCVCIKKHKNVIQISICFYKHHSQCSILRILVSYYCWKLFQTSNLPKVNYLHLLCCLLGNKTDEFGQIDWRKTSNKIRNLYHSLLTFVFF